MAGASKRRCSKTSYASSSVPKTVEQAHGLVFVRTPSGEDGHRAIGPPALQGLDDLFF